MTAGVRLVTPPTGVFRNRNIMTPDVRGYYKLRLGYAELSTGDSILRPGATIYGVTVRNVHGIDESQQSRLFGSPGEAFAYIERLS